MKSGPFLPFPVIFSPTPPKTPGNKALLKGYEPPWFLNTSLMPVDSHDILDISAL